MTKGDSIRGSHLKDFGKLLWHVSELQWLVNMMHQIRIVASHFFKLEKRNKSKIECSKANCLRIKSYFSHMLKQHRGETIEELVAVTEKLNHLFGLRDECSTWCPPTKQTR